MDRAKSKDPLDLKRMKKIYYLFNKKVIQKTTINKLILIVEEFKRMNFVQIHGPVNVNA